MQLVSWATLLTLLVPDLVEMRSPDSAAAVRKDRLHPRQGNMALDPQAPPPTRPHTLHRHLLEHALGRAPRNRGLFPFPRKNYLSFWSLFLLWVILSQLIGREALQEFLGHPPLHSQLFLPDFFYPPYPLSQINSI